MSRSYQTELTTTCMIHDRATGRVVVQERTNGDWTGLCFPGGHVEDGESYTECVIREVREETGLVIRNPRMEGIVHWEDRDTHARTVIVFFRASRRVWLSSARWAGSISGMRNSRRGSLFSSA